MYWRQVVADAQAKEAKRGTKPLMESDDFRGGFSGRERDVFFYNPPAGEVFFQIAYAMGLDFLDDGRAFAPVDIDGDGDLDLATVSLQQLRLMENRVGAAAGHFARVRLKATKTQHHALGARVFVEAGGVKQQDYVKRTAGFQTQVPLELHFGLGAETTIDRLTIRWPSGAVEVHEGLPADRRIFVTEGSAPKVVALPAWPEASRPKPLDSFSISAAAERMDGLRLPLAREGAPVVVNFWAPWCAPCKEELPVLAKLAKASGTGVQFVGVSVERDKRDDVASAVKTFELEYPQFYADDPLMASFFGEDGSAPLPSTFVFDAKGRLVRGFSRAITEQELVTVLAAIEGAPLDVEFVLPLSETYLARKSYAEAEAILRKGLKKEPANQALLAQLGNALAMAGRRTEAVEILEQVTVAEPGFAYAWYALGVTYKKMGRMTEALAALGKAVRVDPANVDAWMSLGSARSRVGDMLGASEAFEAVVEQRPQVVAAWVNLGKARVMLKRPDAAEAFVRALQLDPRHREAQALLQEYGPK